MRKQKISLVLLAVAIFGIIGVTAVSAYEVADSFQSPLANYVINNYDNIGGNNRFGKYLWYDADKGGNQYHAGEDLKANPLTPVYAIANGQVKKVSYNSAGYEQVVVIEHKLPPDGTTKVVSIYGHLSERAGYGMTVSEKEDIVKGKIIGYIGYDDENGEAGPHLHFGIRKGAYNDASPKYEGRTTQSGLANFHKPSDFLNLIRTVNTNDVYRLSNLGSKTKIQSASAFDSCQWNWDDIRPVSSTEMSRHSTFNAQSACFTPGTFIKRIFSSEISIIKSYDADKPKPNLYRQPFGSWEAFIREGGKSDLSNVRVISDTQYKWHVQGATIN